MSKKLGLFLLVLLILFITFKVVQSDGNSSTRNLLSIPETMPVVIDNYALSDAEGGYCDIRGLPYCPYWDEDVPFEDYVFGVLKGEVCPGCGDVGTWYGEVLKAQSVAVRSVAWTNWTDFHDGHEGIRDTIQKYYPERPGFPATETFRYTSMIQNTEGEYMTHPDGAGAAHVIDASYKADNAEYTVAGVYAYLQRVYDPISALYGSNQGTGMGQKALQRWMTGQLDPTRVHDGTYDVRWRDYKQLLAHYYTNIHMLNRAGDTLTPPMRFNVLTMTLSPDTRNLYTGQSYQCHFTLQNTGAVEWHPAQADNYYALSYWWYNQQGEKHGTVVRSKMTERVIVPGDTWEITIDISDVPAAWQGLGQVRFDMLYFGEYAPTNLVPHYPRSYWFSADQNQDWFTYDLRICYNAACQQVYLPAVLKSPAAVSMQAYPAPGSNAP